MKIIVVEGKVAVFRVNAESVRSKGTRLLNAGTMIGTQARDQVG